MKEIVARLGLSLCLFAALLAVPAAAHAQTDVTPRSPAQSLSCLLRPETTPSYPSRLDKTSGNWQMRVLLRFEQADAPPKVEVLANTAIEALQDQVFRYLKGYRLPCLLPSDGVVRAVQEFSFRNSERAPAPLDPDDAEPSCTVLPRRDVNPPYMRGKEVMHVVAVAIFSGGGDQAPEVKIIHSTATPDLDRLAVERMSENRPAAASLNVLKREVFGLGEFLGMTKGAEQLQAFFDFRTMGCPFKVNYHIYAPVLPNETRVVGSKDPNRQPFLRWLSERELNLSSAKVANDLFGQVMQIDIPCGDLNLQSQAQ